MNAYKRHGLNWSDVLDYATFGAGRKQFGAQGRLAGNQFNLSKASALRRERAKDRAEDFRVLRDVDSVEAALRYIAKAREWRLELQG